MLFRTKDIENIKLNHKNMLNINGNKKPLSNMIVFNIKNQIYINFSALYEHQSGEELSTILSKYQCRNTKHQI